MKKIIILFTLALTAWSCRPGDATKDYGFAKVYIPQATVTGLDNSYPIPSGPFYQNSVYTCKYDKAAGKLDIALGVIRSGYFSNQKAFSVTLSFSQAVTDVKLDDLASGGTAAAALPASLCTIPGKIEVPSGTSGGTCYVQVDMKALAQQKASFTTAEGYKLLVLGLEISDPTEYELADNYTSVAIVLDLNSEHWDNVKSDKPESEIRNLFPTI